MTCRTSFTLVRKEHEKPFQLDCQKALELLNKLNLTSQEEYFKTVSIEKKWPQVNTNQSYNLISPHRFHCLLEGAIGSTNEEDYKKCTQACLKQFGGRIKLNSKDSHEFD